MSRMAAVGPSDRIGDDKESPSCWLAHERVSASFWADFAGRAAIDEAGMPGMAELDLLI